MSIFNTRKKAKERARDLASQYNIKYNPDGESYSIYDTEGLSEDKGRTDLMLGAEESPFGRRKKRLTNRYYQKYAEKHNLEQLKAKRLEDEAYRKSLEAQILAEQNKGGPGTSGPGTGGPDVKVDDLIAFNPYQFAAKDFDLSSDLDTDFTASSIPMGKISPYTLSDKLKGVIPTSDIYDLTSLNPFANFMGISHSDFTNAKNEGKSYIVKDNEVYDVNENLNRYNARPDSWSARETPNYHRTLAIGQDLGGIRNAPLTLTQGKRGFGWEMPNLLENVSSPASAIKSYGRILKAIGPELTNLLKKMSKTNPKKVKEILETSVETLKNDPNSFKRILEVTQKAIGPKTQKAIGEGTKRLGPKITQGKIVKPKDMKALGEGTKRLVGKTKDQKPLGMDPKNALQYFENALKEAKDKSKYIQDIFANPDLMKTFKKDGGKLIAR